MVKTPKQALLIASGADCVERNLSNATAKKH